MALNNKSNDIVYDDVVDSNQTLSYKSDNFARDMPAPSTAEEGYVEEIGNDGLKKILCFTCKKSCKNEDLDVFCEQILRIQMSTLSS